jgi:16S rRNA G966 N2-methylase RsmD
LNFTKPGDLILDPFGGSGVTVIEALMTGRKGIHIDLNPMSVFVVKSLIAPVKIQELNEAFERVKSSYLKHKPDTKEAITKALSKYPYPKGLTLPKGSDVETIEKLFTDEQLAQLACLKYFIEQEKNENIKKSLLLVFSSTITKINRTYHNSGSRDENAGNAAPFAYYRYRIATEEVNLDLINSFSGKFKKTVNAKIDIAPKINEDTIGNAKVYKGSATDLQGIRSESIDYIYTDPPYGSKIPYLDLSVMWNAWLDLEVTGQDRELEAIEGGELHKTKDDYSLLISQSIHECYRVLKFDRWMSFVFAHKDPEFWHLIIETAEHAGFEYAGAVKQANGQTSFKKRQNPFTVLAGQLIINFKKVRKPRAILKANLGMNIGDIVLQTIEGVIAKNNGASLEQINDELIIKGLELGFLDLLKKEYSDLTALLMAEFDYNQENERFTIRRDKKFKTSIDLNLRIKYYLMSFLRRQELEHKSPTFDEIVFNIIPLLRNGITPENQTILSVLETIGERTEKDRWKLKTGELQLKMF